jgi:hypothetical protein
MFWYCSSEIVAVGDVVSTPTWEEVLHPMKLMLRRATNGIFIMFFQEIVVGIILMGLFC